MRSCCDGSGRNRNRLKIRWMGFFGRIRESLTRTKQQIVGRFEEIVRQDPFCKQGLAEFRIIEFRASQRADDIPKRVEE